MPALRPFFRLKWYSARRTTSTSARRTGWAQQLAGGDVSEQMMRAPDILRMQSAEGDAVDGTSWEYIEAAGWTAVYSEEGAAVFLLRGYNAEASGINLVQYAPEPAA